MFSLLSSNTRYTIKTKTYIYLYNFNGFVIIANLSFHIPTISKDLFETTFLANRNFQQAFSSIVCCFGFFYFVLFFLFWFFFIKIPERVREPRCQISATPTPVSGTTNSSWGCAEKALSTTRQRFGFRALHNSSSIHTVQLPTVLAQIMAISCGHKLIAEGTS